MPSFLAQQLPENTIDHYLLLSESNLVVSEKWEIHLALNLYSQGWLHDRCHSLNCLKDYSTLSLLERRSLELNLNCGRTSISKRCFKEWIICELEVPMWGSRFQEQTLQAPRLKKKCWALTKVKAQHIHTKNEI